MPQKPTKPAAGATGGGYEWPDGIMGYDCVPPMYYDSEEVWGYPSNDSPDYTGYASTECPGCGFSDMSYCAPVYQNDIPAGVAPLVQYGTLQECNFSWMHHSQQSPTHPILSRNWCTPTQGIDPSIHLHTGGIWNPPGSKPHKKPLRK